MCIRDRVRDDGIEGININALVSFYGPEHFSGGAVRIGDAVISCNYFDQIPREAVEGVYFYMLTAGECLFSSEENIMDFLYADIWGTNYVDAGIQVLTEQHIKRDMEERFPGRQVCLSEEFGPGYFGMPVIETKKFFSILDAAAIDVRVKDSGLMIPQKTCAGLYLVYNLSLIHILRLFRAEKLRVVLARSSPMTMGPTIKYPAMTSSMMRDTAMLASPALHRKI